MRGRIVLSPLSQEMAVFKSISRASCTSLTSRPCTNPDSQQSVLHEYHGSDLMEGETWVDLSMERAWIAAEPLYIICGDL